MGVSVIGGVVGVLAVVGLVGIVWGAASRRPRVRRGGVALGGGALALAGLLLVATGLFGISDPDEILYGFLLIVFGTGVTAAPGLSKKTREPDTPAR